MATSDNKTYLFVRDKENKARYKYKQGNTWHPSDDFNDLGDTHFASDLTAVGRKDKKVDVFGVDLKQTLYWKTYDGSDWKSWESLSDEGSVLDVVAAWASKDDNKIDLFVRYIDNSIRYKQYDGSKWQSDWSSLFSDRFHYSPSTVKPDNDNHLVFAIGATNNHLYVKAGSVSALESESTLWTDLGGVLVDDASVVTKGKDYVATFHLGTTGQAFLKERLKGTWDSSYKNLGGSLLTRPAAHIDSNKLVTLFARDDDNRIVYASGSNKNWSGWSSINDDSRYTSKPVVNPASGSIQVFLRDTSGTVFEYLP